MKIRNRRLLAAAGWLGDPVASAGSSARLRFDYRSLGRGLPVDPRPARTAVHLLHLARVPPHPDGRFGNPDVAVLVSRHADGAAPRLAHRRRSGWAWSSARPTAAASRRSGSSFTATTSGGTWPSPRTARAGRGGSCSRGSSTSRRGRECRSSRSAVGYAGRGGRRAGTGSPSRGRVSRASASSASRSPSRPSLRSDELEHYRLLSRREMDRLTAVAERWADTNRFEVPAAPAEPRPPGWRLDPVRTTNHGPDPLSPGGRPWRRAPPDRSAVPPPWWAWLGTRSAALVAVLWLCLGVRGISALPRPDLVRHPSHDPGRPAAGRRQRRPRPDRLRRPVGDGPDGRHRPRPRTLPPAAAVAGRPGGLPVVGRGAVHHAASDASPASPRLGGRTRTFATTPTS